MRGTIQYISITVLSFNFIGKNIFEYSPKKKKNREDNGFKV